MVKALPMLLDRETALLARRGVKTQRRWPLPDFHEQLDVVAGMPEREGWRWPAELGHGGRWGWPNGERLYGAPVPGPGALLYVREAYALASAGDARTLRGLGVVVAEHAGQYAVARSALADLGGETLVVARWSSAIHMPAWAATQWLLVEELYAHRLHAITFEEAAREGVGVPGSPPATLAAFPAFWNARHPEHKWDDNPVVAAVQWRTLDAEEAREHEAAVPAPDGPPPTRERAAG